jgi:hypothetical protein
LLQKYQKVSVLGLITYANENSKNENYGKKQMQLSSVDEKLLQKRINILTDID